MPVLHYIYLLLLNISLKCVFNHAYAYYDLHGNKTNDKPSYKTLTLCIELKASLTTGLFNR